MLQGSKALDPKRLPKGLAKPEDRNSLSDKKIKSQHIGKMFDDFMKRDHKISFKTRMNWIWNDLKGAYHDFRYRRRNRRVWCKTLNKIRPWEGFHGMLCVMQTHLRDYMETEEKYGHSIEEERIRCIDSVKEVLEILERMKDPNEYYNRLKATLDARYPDYKQLVTHYETGGSSYSGDFVAQGNGWVGQEAGNDPREGYFEFVNGKFELVASPDKQETKHLLAQMHQYHEDTKSAYRQAEMDSDADFARLVELLREHMYSWWD